MLTIDIKERISLEEEMIGQVKDDAELYTEEIVSTQRFLVGGDNPKVQRLRFVRNIISNFLAQFWKEYRANEKFTAEISAFKKKSEKALPGLLKDTFAYAAGMKPIVAGAVGGGVMGTLLGGDFASGMIIGAIIVVVQFARGIVEVSKTIDEEESKQPFTNEELIRKVEKAAKIPVWRKVFA